MLPEEVGTSSICLTLSLFGVKRGLGFFLLKEDAVVLTVLVGDIILGLTLFVFGLFTLTNAPLVLFVFDLVDRTIRILQSFLFSSEQ